MADHRLARRYGGGSISRRWFIGATVAVLASVVGIAVAVQAGAGPACAAVLAAAPPTGNAVHKGVATFYDIGNGGGNCSYDGPPADRLHVALGPSEYAKAGGCGGYVDVTGPKGKVRVKIIDQCPECPTGHLDLSREAFAKIANPVQGRVSISYRAVVNPPLPGPLTFRMKDGTSQYWFAVRVDNHGNPLRSVQVKVGSTWRSLSRTDYNYWLADNQGLGNGPFTIRVTDVYGSRATAAGIRLLPAKTQKSSVVMYGPNAPARRAPGATTPRTGKPTSAPAPSASPATAAPVEPTTAVVLGGAEADAAAPATPAVAADTGCD